MIITRISCASLSGCLFVSIDPPPLAGACEALCWNGPQMIESHLLPQMELQKLQEPAVLLKKKSRNAEHKSSILLLFSSQQHVLFSSADTHTDAKAADHYWSTYSF